MMMSVADTAKTIERTFVEAAGGMGSKDYETGLTAFVEAAKKAYDDGIMVPALNLELSMCGQVRAMHDHTALGTGCRALLLASPLPAHHAIAGPPHPTPPRRR